MCDRLCHVLVCICFYNIAASYFILGVLMTCQLAFFQSTTPGGVIDIKRLNLWLSVRYTFTVMPSYVIRLTQVLNVTEVASQLQLHRQQQVKLLL